MRKHLTILGVLVGLASPGAASADTSYPISLPYVFSYGSPAEPTSMYPPYYYDFPDSAPSWYWESTCGAYRATQERNVSYWEWNVRGIGAKGYWYSDLISGSPQYGDMFAFWFQATGFITAGSLRSSSANYGDSQLNVDSVWVFR